MAQLKFAPRILDYRVCNYYPMLSLLKQNRIPQIKTKKRGRQTRKKCMKKYNQNSFQKGKFHSHVKYADDVPCYVHKMSL